MFGAIMGLMSVLNHLTCDLAKVESELAKVEVELEYMVWRREQLSSLIDHCGRRSPRKKPITPLTRENRRIANAIYGAVEFCPGRYKLTDLARKVADDMGIEDDLKRNKVYQIARGLWCSEQFAVDNRTKKIYPSWGKWSAYQHRYGDDLLG